MLMAFFQTCPNVFSCKRLIKSHIIKHDSWETRFGRRHELKGHIESVHEGQM